MLAACLAAAGPSITLPSLAEPLLQPETRITGVQVLSVLSYLWFYSTQHAQAHYSMRRPSPAYYSMRRPPRLTGRMGLCTSRRGGQAAREAPRSPRRRTTAREMMKSLPPRQPLPQKAAPTPDGQYSVPMPYILILKP